MSKSAPSIIDVSAEGFILQHGDQDELISWEQIEDVAIGTMTGPAGASIFVMAIERAGRRVVVCHEQQPIWRPLIEGFADYLPHAIPFEAWGPALVAEPGQPVVIYTRQAMGSA